MMLKQSYESELLLNLPLYAPRKFETQEASKLAHFFINSQDLQFDNFCVDCQKESTFKFDFRNNAMGYHPNYSNTELEKHINLHNRPIQLMFKCQRDDTHYSSFIFRIRGSEITKIGQFPSVASIEVQSIKKYKNILKNDHSDFSKAIGLFSHGIGAGSFVYLRRIFENLIEKKRLLAAKSASWDNDKFTRAKMDDKIKLLQDYLPSVLVENRSIYAILSKGIHELTEDHCLSLFPDVKLAIELILDEEIYFLEQESKVKSVQRFISKTVASFKS